ncbi:oligosaccharide flippase family protein [Pseudoalteromonas sp. SSDWG2]|uniref:oligosaccharide flippase family protein n=1 Tax=Pseudoalteromonas sp. SSDWG2 TaxID=3139391 RepID=UPI003BA948CD
MKLRRSLSVTFGVQAYSTIVTVALTPVLLTMLGPEGFGLIGFFLTVQTFLQIFDAGVSGTLARQIAIAKGCKKAFKSFISDFYRIYMGFLCVGAILGGIGLLLSRHSSAWFETTIPLDILSFSIKAMLITLVVKYLCGPLKSVLIGLEVHGAIATANFVAANLRYPGGLLVLYIFDNSLIYYFAFQVLVALLEWLLYCILFVYHKNVTIKRTIVTNNVSSLGIKVLLVSALQLTLLSVLWVLVSQVDKLLLSGNVSLEEFGYYSLAVSVAGVILTLNLPISQVLMPRLTSLASSNENTGYVRVLVRFILLSFTLFIPLCLMFFLYGQELIWSWTGNIEAANKAGFYLKWLAIGNLFAILANYSFLVQFSIKKLRRHLIAYSIYSSLLLPSIFIVVSNFKSEGTAIFWVVQNGLFLFFWGLYSFRLLLPNLINTIVTPMFLASLFLAGIAVFFASPLVGLFGDGRPGTFFSLVLVGGLAVAVLIILNFLLKARLELAMRKIELVIR